MWGQANVKLLIKRSTFTMDVTVIIAAYNTMPFQRTVTSNVLQLISSNIPVIIVDDASTDLTWDLIEKLPDRVIKVRLPVNSGPGSARNVACTYTKSEYIMFLDADDYVSEDFFSVLRMHKSDSDVILTSWAEVNNGNVSHLTGPLVSRDYYRSLLGDGILQPIHSVVIRRELFESVGKFAIQRMLCEDFDLWLRLFRLTPNVETLSGIIAYYVRTSAGRSSNVRSTNWVVAKLIFREIFTRRTTARQMVTGIRKLMQLAHR
jgi:glycosyltransferase involved in cell wall biosynthesis